MIIATKTYLNYNTIIEAIDSVKHDIKYVEDEIAYSQNFLEEYLDSEYADYFLAHKNNVLFN
jgi:outer membrane protein assembly factor BamD (BamD/ComL family)